MTDPTADSPDDCHCPQVQKCPLFPLFRNGTHLEVWKAVYCHRDFGDCERFQRMRSGDPVPLNLLPNGEHLPADTVPDESRKPD